MLLECNMHASRSVLVFLNKKRVLGNKSERIAGIQTEIEFYCEDVAVSNLKCV